MSTKVNAKVLVDYKKYKYLLSLQPRVEAEPSKDISVKEDDKEDTEMKSSGVNQDTSVNQLAHAHKELLDNQIKLQNIAEKNFKAENSTLKASMTKVEPKLVTTYAVKTGLGSKSKKTKAPKSKPNKMVGLKKYKEKEVIKNGEKWYRLK
jgi:hypothetical protein